MLSWESTRGEPGSWCETASTLFATSFRWWLAYSQYDLEPGFSRLGRHGKPGSSRLQILFSVPRNHRLNTCFACAVATGSDRTSWVDRRDGEAPPPQRGAGSQLGA